MLHGRLIVIAALLAKAASAESPCLPCHAKQVVGYAKTAMATSLSRSAPLPDGTLVHSNSETRFSLTSTNGRPEISARRGTLAAVYGVEYVVGSGRHAYGILTRVGDYLFQAPISYYQQRAAWGVAPGFENAPALDFARPVTPECLHCHSGGARPVAGTLNRYLNPPLVAETIACGRCHGDASAHLAHPRRGNVVNPATLSAPARDSVCEQCHLSGEIRILNPGRDWGDFRPGMELEQVLSVYVRDDPDGLPIKVISHAEQLALSKCARASGTKFWCGSCHDVHQEPAQPAAYFRSKCLSCHAGSLPATHAKKGDDCVACHMPKRETRDGAHTAFTDHRIARLPGPVSPAAPPPTRLRAWREPPAELSLRNLGLANVGAGRRSQSIQLVGEGGNQIERALKVTPRDPVLLGEMGLVLLAAGQKNEAVGVLEKAARTAPESAAAHINLGTAYRETGRFDKAIAEFNRAIESDPSLQDAYRGLEQTYLRMQDAAGARATLERYLKFMPQSIAARAALMAK